MLACRQGGSPLLFDERSSRQGNDRCTPWICTYPLALHTLSQGSYGVVYKAWDRLTGECGAVGSMEEECWMANITSSLGH